MYAVQQLEDYSYKLRVFIDLCSKSGRELDHILHDLLGASHSIGFKICRNDELSYLETYDPRNPDFIKLINAIFEILCQIHDELHPHDQNAMHYYRSFGSLEHILINEMNQEVYRPAEEVSLEEVFKITNLLKSSQSTVNHSEVEQRYHEQAHRLVEDMIYQENLKLQQDHYNRENQGYQNESSHHEYDHLDTYNQYCQIELSEQAVGPAPAPENTFLPNNSAKVFMKIEDEPFDMLFPEPKTEEPSVLAASETQQKEESKSLLGSLFKKTVNAIIDKPQSKVSHHDDVEDILMKGYEENKSDVSFTGMLEPTLDAIDDLSIGSAIDPIDVEEELSKEVADVTPEPYEQNSFTNKRSPGRCDYVNKLTTQDNKEDVPSKWFGNLKTRPNCEEYGFYGYVKLFGLINIKSRIYVRERDGIKGALREIHPMVAAFSSIDWYTRDGITVAYY